MKNYWQGSDSQCLSVPLGWLWRLHPASKKRAYDSRSSQQSLWVYNYWCIRQDNGQSQDGKPPISTIRGYIRVWNDNNPQCDSISWAPWYREYAFLTTTLRKDMNSIVDKLNSLLKRADEALNVGLGGGIFYVDGFQEKFNGHRLSASRKMSLVNIIKRPPPPRLGGQDLILFHYKSHPLYENPPKSHRPLSNGGFFDQPGQLDPDSRKRW